MKDKTCGLHKGTAVLYKAETCPMCKIEATWQDAELRADRSEARVKELEVKLRRSVERANVISCAVKTIAQNAKEIKEIWGRVK